MERPTARVLSLPTPFDVREEAERLGVPPDRLEGLAGTLGVEAVKLSGVPSRVAAALAGMVSPPYGLAIISHGTARDQADVGTGGRGESQTHDPGPGTQNSEARTHHPQLLLAGPEPLLLEVASRLESTGEEAAREVALALRTALDRYHGRQLGTTRCGNLTFEWGKRTYVMGIINVTPDSFSGDGLGSNLDAAVEQGRRFVEEGADILDVGGESTRPGSQPVPVQEELDRVIPVVRRLAEEVPVPISVDSYKHLVVQEALEAGASMINDVWGLRRTEGLACLSAAYDVPIILMHNRRAEAAMGQLGGHFRQVQYADLMGDIVQELRESVELALRSNVRWENIIVDPGIGFGKTPAHNLVVMRRLRELRSLGRPILMGTSRKSVIGITLGVPMEERLEGTAATVAVSICNGADIVRVHDVKEMARVARMTDAITRA